MVQDFFHNISWLDLQANVWWLGLGKLGKLSWFRIGIQEYWPENDQKDCWFLILAASPKTLFACKYSNGATENPRSKWRHEFEKHLHQGISQQVWFPEGKIDMLNGLFRWAVASVIGNDWSFLWCIPMFVLPNEKPLNYPLVMSKIAIENGPHV